jgi:uncharacterized membrane protein
MHGNCSIEHLYFLEESGFVATGWHCPPYGCRRMTVLRFVLSYRDLHVALCKLSCTLITRMQSQEVQHVAAM